MFQAHFLITSNLTCTFVLDIIIQNHYISKCVFNKHHVQSFERIDHFIKIVYYISPLRIFDEYIAFTDKIAYLMKSYKSHRFTNIRSWNFSHTSSQKLQSYKLQSNSAMSFYKIRRKKIYVCFKGNKKQRRSKC